MSEKIKSEGIAMCYVSKCYCLFKHKALDMEYSTAFGGSVSQAGVQL